jgi:hypothetical protein
VQSQALHGRRLFVPCAVGTRKSCVVVMAVALGVMSGPVLMPSRSSFDAGRLKAKASVRM